MILITGSEGFIGRNLIKHLALPDDELQTFDVRWNVGDVLNRLNQINFNDIDLIYHLGAVTDTSEKDADILYHYNTKFSIELFKKAIRYTIPIRYASSSAVYGNTGAPLNQYAISKLSVDIWVQDHISSFLTDITGFRFFNVYGNDEQKQENSISIVSKFVKQAKSGKNVQCFNVQSHRDLICVEDVVTLISTPYPFRALGPKRIVHDLGTGVSENCAYIAQLVARKYGVGVDYIEMPPFLVEHYQTYTKATLDRECSYKFKSVQDWLDEH